ncbi:MAG: DUF4159 domain-containing protein, partial [Pseudomonadota bacterium]
RTPWPLLLLRMIAAAAVILGLAGPILNAPPASERTGPLALVVDDGWPAAEGWIRRQNAIAAAVDGAVRDNRPVILATTAPTARAETPFRLLSPEEAQSLAATLLPKPWAPDRAALAEQIDALQRLVSGAPGEAEILWLSDGLDHGGAGDFARALAGVAPLTVLKDAATGWAIADARPDKSGLAVTALRAPADTAADGVVIATAADGRYLGETAFAFAAGASEAAATFEAPLSVRNAVAALTLKGRASAGAIRLLDAGARRPFVGIASVRQSDDQPLLSGLFYVERALQPYADLVRAPLTEILTSEANVILLPDTGRILGEDLTALRRWVEDGGTLIRFAGPRLAAASADDPPLLPVRLRGGGRALGGALSWDAPQGLAPFDAGSPFYGLAVPGDVAVSRQVLAEPTVELAARTWARLEDGTPLVTAAPQKDGLVVLYHVTAEPDWSTLPLSGLYVEMLRRTAMLNPARARAADSETVRALPPLRTMDGFGALQTPSPSAEPLKPEDRAAAPGPRRPPGLYGAAGAETAYNAVAPDAALTPLPAAPAGAQVQPYTAEAPQSFAPPLFAAAILLLLIDMIWTLAFMGKLPRLVRAGSAALALVAAAPWTAPEAAANDTFVLNAIEETRFAYVTTGDARIDEISRVGLASLSFSLRRRTALEPADPVAIDADGDQMALFPLIYWPVTADALPPADDAAAGIDAYLKAGGLILFDTRDADRAGIGAPTREAEVLREILERLDIPPLEPVPEEHVLKRSFYLLDDLPGRYAGGTVWAAAGTAATSANPGATGGASNDGVSPVLIGGHDWAAAWARDDLGRPLRPVEPGGERQREMAVRTGINIAMYALTGNYKADQVHIPLLLERLGR